MGYGVDVLRQWSQQKDQFKRWGVLHTGVLFFWNGGLWDPDVLAHSFVVLWHTERFRNGACPGATGDLRSSNSQSKLRFLGLPGSGNRRRRLRLGGACLGSRLRDLGGILLELSCGFILSFSLTDDHGTSGTQSGVANVRGSGRRDSNRRSSLGRRELWLRNRFRFRHGLTAFRR